MPGADVAEIIGKADSAMVQLLDTHQDDPVMLSDVMAAAIDEMDDRVTGCRPSGLLTGVQDFDAITGGLEPGQLVIVATRPSVGKTAFALNVANHIAREGRTVAFFSLEMQRRELAQRLIAMRTGVSVSSMRTGQLQEGGWSRISACRADADGQRLILMDRPAVGVSYVRAVARKIRRQHGLDVICVDYLGLMRGEGQNRNQEIGSLSRGLKALARKFHHCPEIVGGMATATPTMAQRTGMGASRGAILPRRDSSPLPPLLFNMPRTALWPNYGASACAA